MVPSEAEEGDRRLRHPVSTHAARVNPWGHSGWRRHCNTRGLLDVGVQPGEILRLLHSTSPRTRVACARQRRRASAIQQEAASGVGVEGVAKGKPGTYCV